MNGMKFFVKKNPVKGSQSLILEAQGLEILRSHLHDLLICVPKVIEVNENQLILEKIDSKICSPHLMWKFGQELAKLHNKIQPQFGGEKDNFIGLNPQINIWSENWGEFFVEQRIFFQIQLVKETQKRQLWSDIILKAKSNIEDFLNLNVSHPSLLHGDLWSGNYLCDSESVWLIDPALYFGDREVDMAMTEMFNGFSEEFYEGYKSLSPLSEQYSIKKVIYNLYHYLNHYNLFGSGYLNDCTKSFQFIENHFSK